jgi:hypothetical protein
LDYVISNATFDCIPQQKLCYVVYMPMLISMDTAPFTDEWDDGEPTVVERFDRLPGGQLPPSHVGSWGPMRDEVIVSIFQGSDDPTVTHSELPAVALAS